MSLGSNTSIDTPGTNSSDPFPIHIAVHSDAPPVNKSASSQIFGGEEYVSLADTPQEVAPTLETTDPVTLSSVSGTQFQLVAPLSPNEEPPLKRSRLEEEAPTKLISVMVHEILTIRLGYKACGIMNTMQI